MTVCEASRLYPAGDILRKMTGMMYLYPTMIHLCKTTELRLHSPLKYHSSLLWVFTLWPGYYLCMSAGEKKRNVTLSITLTLCFCPYVNLTSSCTDSCPSLPRGCCPLIFLERGRTIRVLGREGTFLSECFSLFTHLHQSINGLSILLMVLLL